MLGICPGIQKAVLARNDDLAIIELPLTMAEGYHFSHFQQLVLPEIVGFV